MVTGFIYCSLIGKLVIYEEEGKIIKIEQDDSLSQGLIVKETPLIRQTIKELDEYFIGKRKNFTIPVQHHRQGFQAKVLEQLTKIPYGVTLSYKEVAELIGHPRAYRAVGGACHDNPIPLLIPCHRVIATNGSLIGFGWGLEMKKALLALEKKFYKYV